MLALRAALARRSAITLRALASTPAPTPAEAALEAKLRAALPGAQAVTVRDSSGGCGTMYTLDVTAAEFTGTSTVTAHKLVTRALKEDITDWHGYTLTTRAP